MKLRPQVLLPGVAAVALAAAALPSPAPAEPPATASAATAAATPAAVTPEAMAVLKRNRDAMAALKTYRAECWTALTYEQAPDGKPRPNRYEMATLTAAKPNLMRYDAWEMAAGAEGQPWSKKKETPTYTFVSDGKDAWRQFGDNYRQDKRVKPEELGTILEPWGGFYSPNGSAFGTAEYYQKEGGLLEARLDGREAVDGTDCDKVYERVKTTYGGESLEYKTTWYIGAKDGLVRRAVEYVSFGGKPGHTRDATLRNIRTNEPVAEPNKIFAYNPPTGVKKEDPKEMERQRPPLLAAGTAAPDFTATDRDGKAVKLSDFKGKVFVLDFWASWCPPCVASMPHNQTVAKKLRAEGLPVVLFAVDNSEERDPFLGWLKAHSELDAITFAHADRGQTDIAGKLYQVSGIPTQYVIDAQGVVRASFVGFGGPTDDLEKAVRQALKAK